VENKGGGGEEGGRKREEKEEGLGCCRSAQPAACTRVLVAYFSAVHASRKEREKGGGERGPTAIGFFVKKGRNRDGTGGGGGGGRGKGREEDGKNQTDHNSGNIPFPLHSSHYTNQEKKRKKRKGGVGAKVSCLLLLTSYPYWCEERKKEGTGRREDCCLFFDSQLTLRGFRANGKKGGEEERKMREEKADASFRFSHHPPILGKWTGLTAFDLPGGGEGEEKKKKKGDNNAEFLHVFASLPRDFHVWYRGERKKGEERKKGG